MRLVTFAASGAQRIGALVDGDRRIVDFAAAHDRAGLGFQQHASADRSRRSRARSRPRDRRRGADKRPRRDRYRIGQAAGAVAGAAAIARLSLFRKASDPGFHPDAPRARREPRPIRKKRCARWKKQGAFKRAENLVRAAELLQAEPVRRLRHRSGRDLAGLFEDNRLRAGIRLRDRQARPRHSEG